jgi:hypothetical protein
MRTFALKDLPYGSSPDSAPRRELNGTFHIAGNTLELGTERHTIFPVENGGKVTLMIDGTAFERSNRAA